MIHLAKRFFQSFGAKALDPGEMESITAILSAAELGLWNEMSVADQRHALKVFGRFTTLFPEATMGERVGVALHDVGKIESDLGTFGRVLATLIGPRTRRFALYHEHEAIGARMLRDCGSSEDAIGILESRGRPDAIAAYRMADHY